MKIKYFFAVFFLVLLSGCLGGNSSTSTAGGGASPDRASAAKWTYMVYMAGDNTLSDAVDMDMAEMMAVGSTASVNIVVQAENDPAFKTGTRRGRIVKNMSDADWTPVGSGVGGVDMANPQTLTDFITWAKTTYPADNYALVLWSHGAGWKTHKLGRPLVRGALEDTTSSGANLMSLADITKGVRDAGVHFGLINFDACLMGMYEVAYALRSTADYLVASEESEPGEGDDYTAILNALTATPTMTALTLSTTITKAYGDFYTAQGRTAVTKSAVSLAKVTALKTAVDGLGATMTANMSNLRTGIQTARGASVNYDYISNHDLGDFAAQLKLASNDAALVAAATAVETAVADAVVGNYVFALTSANSLSRSKGIAIYLPAKNETSVSELASYATLDSSVSATGTASAWADFVSVLVTGDTAVSYVPMAQGNFAYKLVWDNPRVDLDLYVYEPTNLYAPYMGVTTANGFMSGDSSSTGKQVEYYAAATTVEAGWYDVFVNYYDGTEKTTATLYYDDGKGGGFVSLGQFVLNDPTKPNAPLGAYPDSDTATYDAMLANTYGDWYWGHSFEALVDPALRAVSAAKSIKSASAKVVAQRIHLRAQQKSTAAPVR